ncbi:hypothetical protein LTR17_020424 [Elasticomyces elasticus]|nr:hypothetical protein LTR17_020424 [Elasticomyces elasticus]
MSDVLAHLVGIQQGIASINDGMAGLQRNVASIKEQLDALPGIFAVLPEIIGRDVVSHVQDELLQPLGQRMSDLEQSFNGLQTAEKGPTEEVSLLHEPVEAPAAAYHFNCLGDEGLSSEASSIRAEEPTPATEPNGDESEESFEDDIELITVESLSFLDAYDFEGATLPHGEERHIALEGTSLSDAQGTRDDQHYDFETFPYSRNNWGAWQTFGYRDIGAVRWELRYGRDEWTRRRAKSLLDREPAELDSLQQPLEPDELRW